MDSRGRTLEAFQNQDQKLIQTQPQKDEDKGDIEARDEQRRVSNDKKTIFYLACLIGTWIVLLLFAGLLGYYAYEATHKDTSPTPASFCNTPACGQLASSFIGASDPSTPACTDFYTHVAGSWVNNTEIPADLPSWSIPRQMVKGNQAILRKLLETPPSQNDTETQTKCKNFYSQCMDLTAIDQKGAEPILELFNELVWENESSDSNWTTVEAAAFSSRLLSLAPYSPLGVTPLFRLSVEQNPINSSRMALRIEQAGLQLPREYYIPPPDPNTTSPYIAQLDAYRTFLTTLFALAGENDTNASEYAGIVMDLEAAMAEINVPLDEYLTNPYAAYNPMTLANLTALCPNLPWTLYFRSYFLSLNLSNDALTSLLDSSIVVTTPSYFANLSELLATTSPDKVMIYLKAKALIAFANILSQPFRLANQKFNEVVSGTTSAAPRWKDCLTWIDTFLGFALGKLYVDETFPGTSKQIASEMTTNIIKAFTNNLPNVKWLDDATRKRALEKANLITVKIGYPDFIMDNHNLSLYYNQSIIGATFSTTIKTMSSVLVNDGKLKLAKPVDRSEWLMTPQTVNAYYNPSNNEIVFPAGILQPPVFSKDFPLSVNYGGIGFVIGHELTHGFDNQGSQFDGQGNLNMWWSPQIQQQFDRQAQCIAEQYSKYYLVIDGERYYVNGNLTLGENIADNGGLKMAYLAFQQTDPSLSPQLPGLDITPNQLFFRSFTSFWWSVARPAYQQLLLSLDVHSPAIFRVIGPASNSKFFSESYKCPLSPMSPANKCEVW